MSNPPIHHATIKQTSHPDIEAVFIHSLATFPRHSHDQYGVGVICSGGHRSYSDTGMVDALKGDVISVNPGEIHDGAPLAGRPRNWLMLYFNPELIEAYTTGPGGHLDRFAKPVISCNHLANQVGMLHRLCVTPDNETLAIEEKLPALFKQMFSISSGPEFPASMCDTGLEKVHQRLADAPGQTPGLAALASLANMDRYELVRQFSRKFGITPHAFLIQRRVQKARQLLRQSLSAAEVAQCCGFSDQSHLTRTFRRYLGYTPGQYRIAICA